MTAGTTRHRMTTASSAMATAGPRPNCWSIRSGPRTNAAKTTTMMAAAAVMTRRVASAGTFSAGASRVTVAWAIVPSPKTARPLPSRYGPRAPLTCGRSATSVSIAPTRSRWSAERTPSSSWRTIRISASACAEPCSRRSSAACCDSVPGREKSLW